MSRSSSEYRSPRSTVLGDAEHARSTVLKAHLYAGYCASARTYRVRKKRRGTESEHCYLQRVLNQTTCVYL
eukprot:650782-Rhodomonas_salina.1